MGVKEKIRSIYRDIKQGYKYYFEYFDERQNHFRINQFQFKLFKKTNKKKGGISMDNKRNETKDDKMTKEEINRLLKGVVQRFFSSLSQYIKLVKFVKSNIFFLH